MIHYGVTQGVEGVLLSGGPFRGRDRFARNARLRYSTVGCSTRAVPPDVEVRDLAC